MRVLRLFLGTALALALILSMGAPLAKADTLYDVWYLGPGPIDTTIGLPGIGDVFGGPYLIQVGGTAPGVGGTVYTVSCGAWTVMIPSSGHWLAYEEPLSYFTPSQQTLLWEQWWMAQSYPPDASNPGLVAAIQEGIWWDSPWSNNSGLPSSWGPLYNYWVAMAPIQHTTVDPNFLVLLASLDTPSQPFDIPLPPPPPVPEPGTMSMAGGLCLGLITVAKNKRRN